MANIRDLAVGSVLTAPSPATSGTSLVLQSGQGADMPTDLPFKLLVFPTGAVPSKANSEKVLVTARSTDTLTIVRAQGETTAKNISAGWLVANAVFTEDIFNSAMVTGEVPAGTVNGVNAAFTLASNPTTGSVRVFVNGVRQKITDDYTIANSTITFVTAPPTGSNILVDYSVGTQANSVGTNSFIAKEAVTGTPNGVLTAFTTARAYIGGSLQVYINGILQGPTRVTETDPSTGAFTLDAAPATGDNVFVAYQYNLNPSSNADTVDGIHASTTPTANQLAPLDGSARYPLSVIPSFELGYTAVTSNQSVAGAFDVTGLTVTVDVTAGMKIKMTAGILYTNTTANTAIEIYLMEGATVIATGAAPNSGNAAAQVSASVTARITPTAGSHTYKVRVAPVSGTITVRSANSPSFISAEVIGVA